MSSRSDAFVKDWVSANVHNVPGLEDFRDKVASWVAEMTRDAEAIGISSDELDETVGDAGDYLTNYYEQIRDPELGFKR